MQDEKFTSPYLAATLKEKYHNNVKSISGRVKYARDFKRFMTKMDNAHKRTAKSVILFK